jgi:type II secretory pathway pseudopilin PulG
MKGDELRRLGDASVDDLVGHGHGHGHGHGPEAGYTMVMFVMIIAIMSISMGVAVQTAEFQMRREREAELIFRGKQFIEAIRLYKVKYGRYPMQLKEIYEAKPRVIRKRWKDPITDSENWGIIFLGQETRQFGGRGRQVVGPGGPQAAFGADGRPVGTHTPYDGTDRGKDESQAEQAGPEGLKPGEPDAFGQVSADRKMGPIIGVHSTSTDESIKVYEGHTTYSEWRFIYREDRQQRGGPGGSVPPAQQPTPELPFGVPDDPRFGPGSGRNDRGGGPGGSDPVPTIPRP